MSEELIDRYIDREAIKGDTAYFKKEIQEAVQAFKDAKAAFGGGGGTSKGGAPSTPAPTAPKGLPTAADTENNIKANARLAAGVNAVIGVVKQRFAADAKLQVLQVEGTKITNSYVQATARTTAEIAKYNKEMKLQIAVDQASNGSIEKATALRAKLRFEQSQLNVGTKEGADRSKVLIDRVDKLDAFIKKNSDSLTKQKINIGNYSGAISVLSKALVEVNQKIAANTAAGKQNTAAQEALIKEQRILQQLTEKQAAGFASIRAEYAANVKALQAMKAATGDQTAAYLELFKINAKLKDELSDMGALTKTLGSDTFVFDSMLQGAQALAGAYGVAQGAMVIFGAENEELQKSMQKLQATMTVIQGLQSIANAIQKETAFMQGLLILRQKALNVVMGVWQFILKGTIGATQAATVQNAALAGSTQAVAVGSRAAAVGMGVLRAALIASGIGAILVLIGLAASALSSLGDNAEDAAKDIDFLGAAIERTNTALENTKGAIDNNTALQIEYAKQAGKSESEITALTVKGYQYRIEESKRAAKSQIADTQAILDKGKTGLKLYIDDADDAQQAIEEVNLKLIQLGEDGDKKLIKALENGRDGLKTVLTTLKSVTDDENSSNLTNEQNKTRLADKQRDDAKKAADKARDAAKKAAEDRKAIAERDRQAALDIMRLGIEDRKNVAKAILDNDKKSYEERTAALGAYMEAAQALIDFDNKKVQDDKKATPKEKELANQKAAIATRDLKIQGEIDLQKVIDQFFEKNKANADKMMEQFRKDQDEKIRLSQVARDNEVDLEELELRAEFEKKIIGKNNAEKLRLEEQLNRDIERLRQKSELAELMRIGRELQIKKALLQAFKLSTIDVDAEITKNAIAQSAKRIANAKDEKAKKQAILDEEVEKYVKVAEAATDLVTGLNAASNTNKKNAIQDEIDQIEIRKKAEIDAINASALSEEEKANKIAIIEAVTRAKREEAERKQRRLDVERAQFEKAMGILQIMIGIAKAILNQRYLDAAIGGAMLIKAVATPIPRFKEGKTASNKYQGIALINDGGQIEPHYKADTGEIEMSTTMNRLTHVGKDDIIYSSVDEMLKRITKPDAAKIVVTGQGADQVAAELKKQRKILSRIADKPDLTLGSTDQGMVALMKYGSNQVRYITQETNWN